MAKLICIAVCALMLAIPASAGARVQLSKAEARGVVADVLSGDAFVDAYPDAEWYASYWIERARKCQRKSAQAVKCQFSIFSDEFDDPDTGELSVAYCDGAMRVRELRDEYTWTARINACDVIPA